MKTIVSFLSEPVAVALGWALLHALWQGFVLVLPVALLLHLVRSKSSQLRYTLGVSALLMQVMASVATFWLYYQPAIAHSRSVVRPLGTVAVSAPALLSLLAKPLPWHVQVQWFLETHLVEIVVCWLIGVAVFLVRLVGGWLYVQQLKTTAVQPATAFWQPMLTRLSGQLSVRQPVRILESARVTMPLVVGALKPVILLPIGLATGLTMRQAEAVLAHELAHIKRFDYGVNLLQSVVEVMYFFHPALWWLSARVREERENCCDDLAVMACGDARALAQALARVEEFSQTPVLAMALASHKKLLLNRVRRMLGVSARPVVSNGHLLTLTLATILLATVSVYALQERPDKKPKKMTIQSQTKKQNPTRQASEVDTSIDEDVQMKYERMVDEALVQANMDSIMQSVAKMDYNKIVHEALAEVNMDSIMQSVSTIDYSKVVREALASVGSRRSVDRDSLERLRAYHSRKLDSLSQLLTIQTEKHEALRLQMEKLNFPIEEIERKNEVLNWRKEKLMEQRNALIEKHRRLLSNDGKQKLSQADVEKQLAVLEPEIKKQEANITELNRQFEASNAEQERVKAPMEKLEQESDKLENRIDELSDQIGQHGDAIGQLVERPELPEQPEAPEPPEAVRMNGTVTNRGKTVRMNAYMAPPAPARAPRVPKPPRPVVNVRPAVVPALAPRPPVAPVPRVAPKPVKP